MAKISNFQRIIKENVPAEYAVIVDAIGSPVNNSLDEITNAFNKNITVDDNLNMQYKDIDLSVGASGSPTIITQYKSTLLGKTRGIVVIRVQNLTNSLVYPTNTPFVSFSENSKLITIQNITGLSINNKYRITILGLG